MANAAIDNILARRSIRRFDTEKPLPRELTEKLIECACAAPSARNLRPWHFIVVEDRALLDKLSEVHPYAKMLREASIAIVVCGETERGGEPLRWWEEDCAAAMQNILLAAQALSLGSVWLGVKRGKPGLEDAIKTLFEVPEFVSIMGIAAIGWPKETKDPHSGIDACCLHVDKW